jgi:putative thioredoxin
MAAIDVTDATFQTEVIERSTQVPVVVDLWAPWCGPCRTLGPILEKAVDATEGQVVLAKVNVDENPQIATAFRAQSIPAVHAVIGGQRVDGFIGAYPEEVVERFVESLLPTEGEQEMARLVANGDEASLRQALELEPGHPEAVLALAELMVDDGRTDEALALLARVPETEPVRLLAARARLGQSGVETNGADAAPSDDFDTKLEGLLPLVRDDEAARQEFVDILEVMGPDDPRTAQYRRQLTSRLF